MIGLDLQFPDKAYNKKPNFRYRKVLAKILKVKPRMIDTYLIQKGNVRAYHGVFCKVSYKGIYVMRMV